MEKRRALHYFTKLLVDFMFYCGIIVCALIPVLIYKFASVSPMLSEVPGKTIAVLMVSGVMAIYILWEIRHIFKTLVSRDTNPFILANVKSLRKMAVASLIIAITYIAKCLFWFTMATAIIIIIFAIASLFCLVLADVFEQAIVYKEESDLTV